AVLHGGRRAGDREDSGNAERPHGEHRRATSAHRAHHAAGGFPVRAPGFWNQGDPHRRQDGAGAPEVDRRGRGPEAVHSVTLARSDEGPQCRPYPADTPRDLAQVAGGASYLSLDRSATRRREAPLYQSGKVTVRAASSVTAWPVMSSISAVISAP